MKRLLALVLTLAVCCLPMGCAKEDSTAEDEGIQIITTIFPAYDWVREIAGDVSNVQITWLADNGVDLHSYQPTAQDIQAIASADIVIYVGSSSDAWIADALANNADPERRTVSMLDVLQERVKEEEHVEGMQEEAEEEESEADEHVWLSLKNAEILTGAVTDALCACDEANAQTYRQNLEAYQKKLEELDEAYAAVTKASSRNTVVFADRFPFRYLLDDYGIQYYAAFAGCSAETEASFDTVAFLAQQVNTLDLDVILQIERSAGKIADTVLHTAGKADVKVLTMDSMQAVTAKEVEEGSTYLSMMEKNLDVLREALQ